MFTLLSTLSTLSGGPVLHRAEQVEPPRREGGRLHLHGGADGEGRPGIGRASRRGDAARAHDLLQGHGLARQGRSVYCIREV